MINTDIHVPSYDDVVAAAGRIAPWSKRTPVHTCAALDAQAGRRLYFKCEQFQKVGAFKFRGACNAIMALSDEAAQRGVLTHSSGNHAQAVALAAKLRGIPAYIVMPSTASAVKRAAVQGYGAEVVECIPTLAARETTAAEVQERTGAHFVHPYDNFHVIAGQGTAAMELVEEVPELDTIVAPVGGGGLLAGTVLAAGGRRVCAGEPLGADDAWQSMQAGRLIPQTGPDTIADGLLTSVGHRNWALIQPGVSAIIRVEEEEIRAAMEWLWTRAKLLVETSSAVALAAVLRPEFRDAAGGRDVGIILSGGNVDVRRLPWV
jgi:threonine dehydratase